MKNHSSKFSFSAHGWLGLILIVVFWYLNWFLEGLRTHWAFFPLWLGYCLTIDALVKTRSGSSLFTRSPKKYFGLFLISAPSWWLFELFNIHLNNWQYIGKEHFTDVEYALLASLSFSTVIPAVFGSAELVATFRWVRNLKFKIILTSSSKSLLLFFTSGVILLLAIFKWPDVFYPFIWAAVYFIIEPLNVKAGYSSLFEFTKDKNWQALISLSLGCLICAFFWEMWNYYSYPKWVYNLPHVNAPKLFEMPLPGYIGYIPFSLELFALTSLVYGIFRKRLTDFLKII